MRLNGRPKRRPTLSVAAGLAVLAFLIGWVNWPSGSGPDLIVYGATPQGVMAAVTAARQGERVVLLEPGSGIGGQLTQAWVATLDMSVDAHGIPLAQGLFHEFFRGLHHDNSFDVQTAQTLLEQMVRSAGVQVQLGTEVAGIQLHLGRVTHLTLRGPRGVQDLAVRDLIDASDTARLAVLAGAKFTVGREDTGLDHAQMAATLVFRIQGANLNTLAELVHQEHGHEDGHRGRSLSGLVALTSGYLPSNPARFHLRGFNAAIQQDGSLLVNALMIYGVDGTSEASIHHAYTDGVREAQQVVRYLHDRSPAAFGQATFGGVAPRLYLRESRHLLGVRRLTASDVLYGHTFPDAVAVNAYALDGQGYLPGQPPFLLGTPAPYGVPLSTLLPPGLRNLLVVSQAASFDSVAAFSARVVPLQMALGEAAGEASMMAYWLHLDYPTVDQNAVWTALLRGLLRLHHGRVDRPARLAFPPCRDESQPGAPQAQALLRSGLMSAPYYYVGCLYLDQPETARTFLDDLQHAAGNLQDTRFNALRADLTPGKLLTVQGAQALFASLGLNATDPTLAHVPATRVLKRGEAAALRWSLIRNSPLP